MSFIGIDLGATFLKGAWLHPETGRISDVQREPFPSFQPGLKPGRREVPSTAVLDAVFRLLKRLLEARSGPCAGLLLCGQMHGFVLTDASGTALGNFISWQDARCNEPMRSSAESCFEAALASLGDSIRLQLGNEFRPGLPAATLHAMRLSGELPTQAMPLGLADFVAAHLCAAAPVTDLTDASAHGLLYVARGEWHHEALVALGLSDLRLPSLQPTTAAVGRCSLDGREFPVFTPVGDQQAALLGAELVLGELSLNIATGSQTSALSATPQAGDWQLRPFFNGQWLRTVTHLPAGRALNRLTALCGELAADQGTPVLDPWPRISRLAEAAETRNLSINLAFFSSAYGDLGAINGMCEDEISVGHLFRAAFRAMAENYERSARRVAPNGWSRIVFSGGLVQKLPVLQKEIIARLSRNHRFATHEEDTLMGLLFLARRLA
jgi:sugar (pentulose or hexulose) kinase